MTNNSGREARKVHANFFKRCEKAIEDGYGLEAFTLEYAYLEARTNKIMNLLNTPCGICANKELINEIGLYRKLMCIKNFIATGSPIFEKTHLDLKLFNKMGKWTNKRNTVMHRLYFDTEKYFDQLDKISDLASTGLEYARMFSKESNRLKNLKARKPELFENHGLDCKIGNGEGELKPSCKKIKDFNSSDN